MTKTEKLNRAYEEMKQGKIIEFKSDRGKYYNCKCWIAPSSNPDSKRNYIFWRSFGQSANRMSLSNLRWIAKVIGTCTTYDYDVVPNIY